MHVEMPLSFWIFVISFLAFRSRAQMETEPLVGEAILQVSSMEQRIKCNGTFRSISNVRGEIFSNITNVDGKMLYRPESNCQYVISGMPTSFYDYFYVINKKSNITCLKRPFFQEAIRMSYTDTTKIPENIFTCFFRAFSL